VERFIAPVGMGLALFIAELVGVFYTGGSLNPSRSFGPCVVTGTFNKEHWIYCEFTEIASYLGRVLTMYFSGWPRNRCCHRRRLLQGHQVAGV
jgi:glycerol uptake facilitator-like aquaporin